MNFAFYTHLKIFGYIVFVSLDWSSISNKRLKFNEFFLYPGLFVIKLRAYY